MSSLRTLHEAFAELERQADALTDTPQRKAPVGASHRRRPRRALVAMAAVSGAAVIVIAAAVGVSLHSGTNGQNSQGIQPAAAAADNPTTVWMAENASCPARTSHAVSARSVLHFDDGCIRLVKSLATFQTLDATASAGAGGQWWVQVSLSHDQAIKFARASKVAEGHLLAITDSGMVLSAPTVEGVFKSSSGGLQIAASSKTQAKHYVQLLTAS